MTGINPNNMLDYKWSEFKPGSQKTESGKVESLEQALEDGKLTQNEIETLKEKFKSAKSGATDEDFYSALSQSTGVYNYALKSASNNPVELNFSKSGNQIVASRVNGSKSEYAGGNDGYDVKDGKVEVKNTPATNNPTKPVPSEASFREALGGLKTVEVSKKTKTVKEYDWAPTYSIIPESFLSRFSPKPKIQECSINPEVSNFGWTPKEIEKKVTSEVKEQRTVESLVEGGKPSDIKALQKAINDGRPEGKAKISEDGALGPKTLAAAADNFQKNPSEENKQIIKDIIDGKYGKPNENVKVMLQDLIAEPEVSASSAKMTSDQIKTDVAKIVIATKDVSINEGNAEQWKSSLKNSIALINEANPTVGAMVEAKVKELATERADKIINVSAQNIHEAKALVTSGFIAADHPLQAKVKAYEASNGMRSEEGIKELDVHLDRSQAEKIVKKLGESMTDVEKVPDNFEEALALAAINDVKNKAEKTKKQYTQFIPKVTQLADGSYHVEVFCK